jgi:hypothetical protein
VKFIPLLIAALLAIPTQVQAADTVKIDVYLAGSLQQSVSLVGPNAMAKFSPLSLPGATIELRLIAPEPVILEMKETTADGAGVEVVGRVKMATPGGSVAVADIKGAKFRHPYVLVRVD